MHTIHFERILIKKLFTRKIIRYQKTSMQKQTNMSVIHNNSVASVGFSALRANRLSQ